MRIVDVLPVPVRAGYFAEDQAAIRDGAAQDGFGYIGDPVTLGFRSIREPGEALSVLLALDDGTVEYGDCAAVQYSGAGGRDPVFSSASAAVDVAEFIAPVLIGRELTSFRELTAEVDAIRTPSGALHAAIRYGVSQAVLAAVAASRRLTMAEIVRDEYRTDSPLEPVPMYAQSGDDRYLNAEKMILKGVDVLPHASINTAEKLGRGGAALDRYLRWLVRRIGELGPSADYRPRIQVDTYGTIGQEFAGDIPAIADYLARLGETCSPYLLTVEHPVDAGSRDGQIECYAELRRALRRRGTSVRLAVDEWCNTLDDIRLFVAAGAADVIHVKMPDLGSVNDTIEALLLVRRAGLEAFCGGTCNETDRSAQVSAHIAMACGAGQVLAKPGMGVDEGLMIVGNEMARTAAIARSRPARSTGQERAVRQLRSATERLERIGRPLNAVVATLPAPRRANDGPLLGMPIAVKDMIDVAGVPRGNGNPEDMAGPPTERDAPVVAALRAAAADVFATSAMLEYAAGAQHPALPEARNPADPTRTAGGSSGGSAALVRAGVCPAALGTDTGGSIRLPAHYCGVVGFKPTFGALSVEGVQPLSATLDHVGILARDVATTSAVFSALSGRAAAEPPDSVTVAVLVDQLADSRLDRQIADIVSRAVERLHGRGTLVERDGSALGRLNEHLGVIVHYEAWRVHGAAMAERPSHFGAPTARLLLAASHIPEAQYLDALAARDELMPDALAVLDGVDLLLGPAGPFDAPAVSPPVDTPDGAIEGIFTQPYNMTGQPAIVLPCGVTAGGLPVGLQLAAAPGKDAQLLAGAAVVERVLAETRGGAAERPATTDARRLQRPEQSRRKANTP